MTIASIDLGSNSVILLMMEYDASNQKIIRFKDYYSTPRIGENLSACGYISTTAIQRLESVLDEFSSIINSYNCESVLISATNAFRIAQNGTELKNYLENKYHWQISILSGEEEARISFLGAILPTYYQFQSLLIDIGGGSTEVSFGDLRNLHFRQSMQLGIVTLKEMFFTSEETPVPKQIDNAQHFIKEALSEIKVQLTRDFKTLAVAGTPTTLSAIVHNVKKYSNELIDNTTLTLNQIYSTRLMLQQLSYNEMRSKFGDAIEGREDLIVGGSLILEETMNYLGIDEIIVSTRGVRYGSIYDYLLKKNYTIRN
jgi:exopolyphosphatase/guanosine-5'-triphosphate,3'-diphosphate pyrophosphatase